MQQSSRFSRAAQLLRHRAQIWLVLIEMGPNLVGTDYVIAYRAQIWLVLIEMGPNLVGTDYVIAFRTVLMSSHTL